MIKTHLKYLYKRFILLLLLLAPHLHFAQAINNEREEQLKNMLTELKGRYDEVIIKDWLRDNLSNTIFLVRKAEQWGACVGRVEIIHPQYSSVILAPDPTANKKGNFLFVIKQKEKIGLGFIMHSSNYEYKEILPAIYNDLKVDCNHTGYITNRSVPNFIFNVQKGNKWGIYMLYFKKKETLDEMACDAIVDAKYDEIYNNFYHGYALVRNKSKWGMLGANGKEYLPLEYDRITETNSTCQEMLGLKKNNKWGIYDMKAMQIICPPLYDSIACSDLNYVKVWRDGKTSVFNRISKKEGISSDSPMTVDLNVVIKQESGKIVFYTNDGKKINSEPYDRTEYFNYRFIKVILNGKTGLLDKSLGREFIPTKYDFIEHYYQTKSSVYWLKENGLWGFADSTGKIVAQPQYESMIYGCLINEAGRDNTLVTKNGKWGIINAKGEIICEIKYDNISKTMADRPVANISLEKKHGIIDLVSGKVIVPILYEEVKFGVFKKNMVYPYPIDYYTAKLMGKTIYLSPDGKEIQKPEE